MLTMVFYTICFLVIVLVVLALTRPDKFQVQRKVTINTSPEKIFTYINDFQKWNLWSPWENRDPGMKKTFGNITVGQGAVYNWEGNKDVGKGRMEITESIPPSRLTIKLDFISPFEAHNIVEFILVAKGGSTEVTWDMQGPMPFISKLMSVFISMDRMVGKDFETGLASLKAVSEK